MPPGSYLCVDARLGDLATLHVLDELGGEQRRLFEAHVEACAACAEHVRIMRDLMRAARSVRGGGSRLLWRAGASGRGSRFSAAAGAIIVAAAVALIVAVGISQQRAASAALLGQVRALQTQIAELEEQNDAILRTLERESGAGEPRVQGVRGARFVFPPNL